MKLNHDIVFPKIKGITFYLAGGAVRDLIMNVTPKDEDYVMITDYSFDEVLEVLKKDDAVRIYQVKPEFQIILAGIKCGNRFKSIDLAFPRVESNYTDGRRPDTTERTNSLKEDASRRDFTVNAMYMAEDGEVIDYFDGVMDIINQKIRAVGNAEDRFNEDALRILRALRFSVKLDFGIELNTSIAIQKCMPLIQSEAIAMDRIRAEINEMLKYDPIRAMRILSSGSLLYYIEKKGQPFRFEMRQKE